MWSFVQLSDPHVAPLPAARLRDLWNKRVLGFLSWRVRRRAVHLTDVLACLVRDVHAQAPDHTVVTGDIANLALPEEFVRGAAWLRTLGSPHDVSIVPGNHDAYVAVPWDTSVGLWASYMGTEEPRPRLPRALDDFPFVRVRDRVAFVGISTARPMKPFLATGEIGAAQMSRVEEILLDLRRRNLFRVVMMHHPPTAHATKARKRLVDAEPFREVIARVGAELVIHGHTHRPSLGVLRSPCGATPVVGTPSASASRASGDEHYARYHIYRLDFTSSRPRLTLEVRGLDPHAMAFATESVNEMSVPFSGAAEAVS
jgi:3',5'-cyclic AMP phosphodiesterase CpdA